MVEKAQQGDESAFQEICQRFAGLVKKHAGQAHLRPIREEALAECWLAVVQAVKYFQAGAGVPFAGYVESRVRYAAWNLFKRERRHWQREFSLEQSKEQEEDGPGLLEVVPDHTDIVREVENRLIYEEVVQALAGLPERQRYAVTSLLAEDSRLSSVAAELGVTIQAVHNLRRRGLARLKAACSGMYGSERG
ncbi:hypothetical protein P22_0515 [Propionispora sp. 2/2-37]|nr:hypothetical protein P22_0515 [Propionispora sp. 2/2-37]